MFEFATGRTGLARAGYRHTANPELVQAGLDGGLPITAVASYRPRRTPNTAGDACDRRRQLRPIGGVTHLDAVVEDHPPSALSMTCAL